VGADTRDAARHNAIAAGIFYGPAVGGLALNIRAAARSATEAADLPWTTGNGDADW
jgi:hypothetical protein